MYCRTRSDGRCQFILPRWCPLVALCLSSQLAWVEAYSSDRPLHVERSYWYDWGWYGGYPTTSYESFGAESPFVNIVKQDNRCDESYTFIEPRGKYVETPGPVILDNDGNLVWTETKWGQAMDLKVQKYQGKDYITFWRGTDSGTFGTGSYLMLDESYEIFKEISPVGEVSGDLHEFLITEEGTVLMTIYDKAEVDMSGYGIEKGWIFDSLFQEIDIETGELIFEWHASDHYAVHDSMEPLNGAGRSPNSAFDFFHINSIDKDSNGDYLVSSRYMWAVICISHEDGSIIWQLGGKDNMFTDLSDGSATDMAWNHHAAWYENSTLTVFDNGSNGRQRTADMSRGLLIHLDFDAMTAKLMQAFVAPLKLLSPSQGSVQVLPRGNVLVGWGHTPAFTEYAMGGEVLCDTHFGVIWLSGMGFAKNYRTFKFPWTGRPNTQPDIAVRPQEQAIYVSWNGATEVHQWLIQSVSGTESPENFQSHGAVQKTTFETKLEIPDGSGEFIRVAALNNDGDILGYSVTLSKHENTAKTLLEAPSRGWVPEPLIFLIMGILFMLFVVGITYRFRSSLKNGFNKILRKGISRYRYQRLPTR